jgi:hypothetical protein
VRLAISTVVLAKARTHNLLARDRLEWRRKRFNVDKTVYFVSVHEFRASPIAMLFYPSFHISRDANV